jgi:hypothetical protein
MNANDQMYKNIAKFAAAINKPSTPSRRKPTVRCVPQKTSRAVELGFPANLAQFCFGLKNRRHLGPSAPALEKLLVQTIKNCRRLQRIPPEDLRPYARGMTEFPMLVSLRTSQAALGRSLGPSGIDLAGDRGPAHRFNAHWPEDQFSALAEEFLFKLYGGPPGEITFDLWRQLLRPFMRLAFKDYLSQNPAVAKQLESLIASQKDRRNPSTLRERVISRLLDRAKNFFDLRAQR